ncbi:MAG: 6-bladed beta-propeller [Dehalococcoidia bacterium]|nr:6-bladed beta-propeller [Dehalococcoidia bacterium]
MTTATETTTLEYIKTIGITNNGDNGRGFANPYSIAVSGDGRIYVLSRCDPARATAVRVGVQDIDENFLFEFSEGYGSGPGQLVLPVAIAFDSQERLYITDEYNHRVVIYSSEGKFLDQWGEHGSEPGKLNGPAGIAIDSNDNVYIADQHSHAISKFTSDGRFINRFGREEDVTPWHSLYMPWGLCIDADDNVLVADWRHNAVKRFSPDGRHLQTFGGLQNTPGGLENTLFNRPSGVAVDSDGYIYVTDWGNERLQVLTPNGALHATERGRATLSQWAEDFFKSNPDEVEVRAISNLTPELPSHLADDPYQVSAQSEPYFWGPVAVTVDGQDRVYVVESNRHRFQIYKRA